MVGLRLITIIPVLMALILSVVGHEGQRLHARHAHGNTPPPPCTNDPNMYDILPPCPSNSDGSAETTESNIETTDITTDTIQTTTSAPSSLQRAHWCRFPNGTYLPLGYTYMNSPCSFCQCAQSRAILCQPYICMPTYCLDNSMPTRRPGQCCTQCGYENSTSSCSIKNVTFPHGTVIEAIEDKMQCWCQFGNIECRNYMGTLTEGLVDGSAVIIIVIVLAIILIFGFLLCCTCTLGFFYYYQRNKQAFQQAYDQYTESAGWQPVEEGEEAIVDPNAEEKQIEAEKYQYENPIVDVIPPPYAAYDNSYASEQEKK